MQLNLHQTHHEIGDFEAIFQYITNSFTGNSHSGLHLFPELYLTGYPLQDLVLKKSFIEDYLSFLNDLSTWSKKNFKAKEPTLILLGGLKYQFDQTGLPTFIKNVIYKISPGEELSVCAIKQLLPNYDLYEEKKYFKAGHESSIIDFDNKKIALLVCEDMWFSHLHDSDPVEELKRKNEFIDLIINFSASPYHLDKDEKRINRAKQISTYLNAPFAYINRVGAEDEILFDGQSFVVNGDLLVKKASAFSKEILTLPIPEYRENGPIIKYVNQSNTWEELYQNRIVEEKLRLLPLEDHQLQMILNALIFGIHDYATKIQVHKFTIALSGGMDSSLVITILKLMKDRYKTINGKMIEVEAVFMPGFYSSSLSYDLSYDLCQNLGFKITSIPIKFIHSAIKNSYKDHFQVEMTGFTDENIQSRLRGTLIYARSNQAGSMVLNTSNKSEIAVGYSTQYGDSVGALSVLGDLYKTEVFELATYINKNYKNIIPPDIISRPPSAELRENQEDAQSLPPYEVLDPILEGLLSMKYSPLDLIRLGFSQDHVNKVFTLYSKSEYKRRQFCPIIKIKPKSFGFGYRVPICKKPF
jgi:NAD+ synthase (glutamine-hydrolysing)